jgi:spectinomycin phosphotransferase
VELGELKLVLFPYFNGNSLDHFSPGSDLLMQVGMCIHAIHSTVEKLPPEMRKSVPQETFDHHQAMTRRVLAHADLVIGPGGAQADLRALIRCKRREMEDIFHTARLFGEREQKKQARQVLCHADIHLGNILANSQGAFRIIDWDGIMLAPPERDLMFFGALNLGNPRLEGYGRDIQIDRETIAYYKYEWVLQEFADYGEKIFFRDLGDEQKQDALEKFIELFEPGNVIDQAHEAGRLLSGL